MPSKPQSNVSTKTEPSKALEGTVMPTTEPVEVLRDLIDFLRKTTHMLEDAEDNGGNGILLVQKDQAEVLGTMLDKFNELPDPTPHQHLSEAGKVAHALRHWLMP
jgi:hypothetical protein